MVLFLCAAHLFRLMATTGEQGGFLPPSRRGIKVDGLITGWDCETLLPALYVCLGFG
eukprot:COSAG01_NODE_9923_length_2301_cov_1.404632_2_plen_57_part_00